MRLTEYTEYGVPRWLDILYDLFEGRPFVIMMVISLVLLYAIGWGWLIFGTICLLFTIKAILEVPEGAGFIIPVFFISTMILVVAPLSLYVYYNFFK